MSEKENTTKANESPTDNEKQSGGVNGHKEEKKPTVTATEPKSVIYIGPNILTEGLKKNTVYYGRPDDLIESLKGKYKNIPRLFVNVESLNKAMADINRAGTPLYLAYAEMKEGK